MSQESAPLSSENIEMKHVEVRPHLELNDGEVLLERASNPVIFEQIVDMLYADEARRHTEEIGHGVRGPDNAWLKDERTGEESITYERYVARTKDEVRADLRERLRQVSTDTPIMYTQSQPHAGEREVMPLQWKIDGTTEATLKMKGAALAHEKGHVLRPYYGAFFDLYFNEALDLETMQMTPNELALYRSIDKEEGLSDAKVAIEVLDYLSQAREIAERMSQLKNYFGLRGAEQFTAEHLQYAREHYVQDTGLDNWMRIFLTAITPKTEPAFLRIINEAGI